LFCTFIFIVLAFRFNGTGDEGDSVMHFLFAKWAFQNPANFLNHWAKPLYVLLASPFAQFGFMGIKAMNVLNFLIAQYCIYKIAEKLKFPNPILPAILYMLAPMNVYLTLSGLTEPMFASVLAISIYLIVNEKILAATIILSFLPFIRTEGMLFCGLMIVFLFLSRNYKYLPLLLCGHLIYSVVGMLAGKKILWVFTENPYAQLSSNYGHGTWDHFIGNMPEILGWGICILLIMGLLYGFYKLRFVVQKIRDTAFLAEAIFILGGFIVFFSFHTIAWKKGIFNSFGLLRVFVGIMPLIVLLAGNGLTAFCQSFIKAERTGIFITMVIIGLLINDFTPKSSYSFNKQTHFSLKADQELDIQVGEYLRKNFTDHKESVIYFQAPYLSETLNINLFDTAHYRSMHDYFENKPRPASYFIAWDDWYAPVDAGAKYEMIAADTSLVILKTFENKDFWNNPRKTILYKNK
jgi:hypothetical protein